MNREDIMEMLEAEWRDRLKAAVLAEREACAKIVEESSLPDAYSQECMPDIANDIRARGYKQDGQCKYCTDGCPACDARKLPEQEPVAWIYKGEKSFDGNKYSDEYELTASKQVALWKDKNAKPLYITPPQRTWVGLTYEEQRELYKKHDMDGWGHFYNAIEAKLKEKNSV